MKKLAQRALHLVRDERGDSIAETLAAILIAALGAAALATMVMVSTSIAMSMEQERARIYTAESSLQPTSSDSEGVASVTIGGKRTQLKVRVYEDADGLFTRYVDENETIGAMP